MVRRVEMCNQGQHVCCYNEEKATDLTEKRTICDMFQKRLQQSTLENLVLIKAAMPLGKTRPPSMIRNVVFRLTLFNQRDKKQAWFTVSTKDGLSHTQCCGRLAFLNNASPALAENAIVVRRIRACSLCFLPDSTRMEVCIACTCFLFLMFAKTLFHNRVRARAWW